MTLRIKPIGITLCVGVFFFMPTQALAAPELLVQNVQQAGKCTGVIVDEHGEPVVGATILVKGVGNGGTTDLDGRFNLPNIKPGSVLVISYIGMDTKEVKWDGQELKVVMKEEQHALNEVVVTGYGGQQKRATLTTAISKMDNKVLDAAAFANVGNALQGSVTGLQVVSSSGQPGAAPSITLRGGASITGSAPTLIIVDGVERALSEVNPSDIESMEVLKAVERVNDAQKHVVFNKLAIAFAKEGLENKTVALWGLSFKPETDDMRESTALVTIDLLKQAGCKIKVYDPVAMTECKRRIGDTVIYARDLYDAVNDADALLLLTEWNEFRLPNWEIVSKVMNKKLLIDGRNIFEKKELEIVL